MSLATTYVANHVPRKKQRETHGMCRRLCWHRAGSAFARRAAASFAELDADLAFVEVQVSALQSDVGVALRRGDALQKPEARVWLWVRIF